MYKSSILITSKTYLKLTCLFKALHVIDHRNITIEFKNNIQINQLNV